MSGEVPGVVAMELRARIRRLPPAHRSALARKVREGLRALPAGGPVGGETRLVGYAVPRPGGVLDPGALRSFLKDRLPEYMLPSVWVICPSLPRGPSGKLDRQSLPQPDGGTADRGRSHEAPRDAVEETLAGIWAEILRLPKVGIHENFFDLGGHSLLATRIQYRILETFQIELPVRVLFEAPTVAEQAQALLAREQAPGQIRKIAEVHRRIEAMAPDEIRARIRQKVEARDSR